MTREEYKALTDDEKRIKVAVCCGWEFIEWTHDRLVGCSPESNPYGLTVPDYLNDLNAMHEAEKLMNEGQLSCYAALLEWDDNGYLAAYNVIRSTAAQRAEAFVLTMT